MQNKEKRPWQDIKIAVEVLGRPNAKAKDDSGPEDDSLMCSLCYAVTTERCNKGCGGVVPVCAACKKQGKQCSFCDDMKAFGKNTRGKPANNPGDAGSNRFSAKKPVVRDSDSSSSEDEEEGLIGETSHPSRSSRGDRTSKKQPKSKDGGSSDRPSSFDLSKLLGSMGTDRLTWWLQSCAMASALFVVGIALAYLMAPEQVTAGAKAIESSLDFGGDDQAVITQGFVQSEKSSGCGDSTIHVFDRQACETAATFLQRRWGGFQKSGGPEGCYTKGLTVYYNTRSTGTLVEDSTVHFICEIGVMLGEAGTTACPYQANFVFDEDVCRVAGMSMGYSWDRATSVATKPKGCYVQEDQVSLNLHPQGAAFDEAKPVCVSSSGASRAP